MRQANDHHARPRGSCGCVAVQEWRPAEPGARVAYRTLVEFLALADDPRPASVIMCLGSRDLHVPIRAAELFHDGIAPLVVCTGGVELSNGEPEALVFATELVRHGVPADRIVVETESTHTGDNVTFGVAAVRPLTSVTSVVAVAWPFVSRRCAATFAHREPLIEVQSVPAFCRLGRPVSLTPYMARRALQQLGRIQRYVGSRQIAHVDIPAEVLDAAALLRSALGSLNRANVDGVFEPIRERGEWASDRALDQHVGQPHVRGQQRAVQVRAEH